MKKNNGKIHVTIPFCLKHLNNFLAKLSFKQIDELNYHASIEVGHKTIEFEGEDIKGHIKYIYQQNKKYEENIDKKIFRKNYQLAKNYEKAGRLIDAATIYEKIDCWEDAGRMREKQNVKDRKVTKHIHVNINEIFDKIKKEGFAVPYKCPSCGEVLKISGKLKNEKCPFCNTPLDIDTLKNS